MVDTKRVFVFVLVGMFLISMMGVVVGAEDEFDPVDPAGEIGKGVPSDTDVAEVLSDLGSRGLDWSQRNLKFTSAVEGIDEYKNWLYAILLGMIIYSIISSFFSGSHWAIKWGITGAVTALAIIGIPNEVYAALEVNYGAMGSAILAVIPFVIILFFTLKVGSLMIARATWIFFMLYMFAMSFSRIIEPENLATGASWPYVIAVVASGLMIYFVGFWRKTFFKGELDSQIEKAKQRADQRKAALKGSDKTTSDLSGIEIKE